MSQLLNNLKHKLKQFSVSPAKGVVLFLVGLSLSVTMGLGVFGAVTGVNIFVTKQSTAILVRAAEGDPCETCNTCGSCNSGTYDQFNQCSASQPSLPGGFGGSCTSGSNACGDVNSGTIGCNGCSATTPSNPSGYGSFCLSSSNSCGAQSTGSIGCNGCSATTPSNPPDFGNFCVSDANACGDRGQGTFGCNGCSATIPSTPSGYGNACGVANTGTLDCFGVCQGACIDEDGNGVCGDQRTACFCPSGYTPTSFLTNNCTQSAINNFCTPPASCTNGATNPPDCSVCPSGQRLLNGSCVVDDCNNFPNTPGCACTGATASCPSNTTSTSVSGQPGVRGLSGICDASPGTASIGACGGCASGYLESGGTCIQTTCNNFPNNPGCPCNSATASCPANATSTSLSGQPGVLGLSGICDPTPSTASLGACGGCASGYLESGGTCIQTTCNNFPNNPGCLCSSATASCPSNANSASVSGQPGVRGLSGICDPTPSTASIGTCGGCASGYGDIAGTCVANDCANTPNGVGCTCSNATATCPGNTTSSVISGQPGTINQFGGCDATTNPASIGACGGCASNYVESGGSCTLFVSQSCNTATSTCLGNTQSSTVNGQPGTTNQFGGCDATTNPASIGACGGCAGGYTENGGSCCSDPDNNGVCGNQSTTVDNTNYLCDYDPTDPTYPSCDDGFCDTIINNTLPQCVVVPTNGICSGTSADPDCTVIASTNIGICNPDNQSINIGAAFNCSFALTGGTSQYILPTEGLYAVVDNANSVTAPITASLGNSALCSVSGATLTCNGVPTTSGTAGNRFIGIHQPSIVWMVGKGSVNLITPTQVDTTAPTISLATSSNSVITASSVTLTATASDNVGVTRVDFYDGTALIISDTTSPYSTSIAYTLANNGSYTYTARAFDAATNTTTSNAVVVTVAIPTPQTDTTAPVVSLATSSISVTTVSSITLTATASDNVGVARVEFYDRTAILNPTIIVNDTTLPYSTTVPYTQADNGTYVYIAIAYDAAGNTTNSNTVTVTVAIPTPQTDTTAPVATLVTSVTSVTTNASALLTVAASDNIGVTKVEFYQGATLLDTDTLSPYTLSIPYTQANNGTYVYTARAYDAAGNTITTNPVTVIVAIPVTQTDTTSPVVVLQTSSASVTTATSIILTANASDNIGVTRVDFYQGTTLLQTDTASPYTLSIPYTQTNNGTYDYTARAYDAAGNNAVSNITTVLVNIAVAGGDTTRPSVTINQIASQKDPTGLSVINYVAVFNEPILASTFVPTDISLSGTATSVVTSLTSSDTITWQVVVTASTFGTVVAAINQNVVTDIAGNINIASTSTDASVSYLQDVDADGINNATEDAGPNNGDANNDGIKDSEQPLIATLPSALGDIYVSVSITNPVGVNCTKFTNISAIKQSSLTQVDSQFNYPYGLVQFDIPCTQADVIVEWFANSDLDKKYRKLIQTTPGTITTAQYKDYSTNMTKVTRFNKSLYRTILSLKDGEIGDLTLLDGKIVDPSGVAESTITPPAVVRTGGLGFEVFGILGLIVISLAGLWAWKGKKLKLN